MDAEKQKLFQDIFGDECDAELPALLVHDTFDEENLKDLEAQFNTHVSRLLLRDQDGTRDSKAESDKVIRKNKHSSKKKIARGTKQKKQQQIEGERNEGHVDDDSEASILSDDEPITTKQRRKASDFPEFDELLEPLKTQRLAQRRKMRHTDDDGEDDVDLGNESDIDENASSLIKSMRHAAEQDVELNRRKMPAIKKVKILTEVSEQLNRRDLHLYFLDTGVLEAVRVWLEPLPDGSLPSFDICRAMLKFLEILPIDRDHLKESGVGKVIMFLYKHPKENVENRRLCETLINKWSRPIFGLQSNYAKNSHTKKNRDLEIDDDDHDGINETQGTQNATGKSSGIIHDTTPISPVNDRRRSSGFAPESKDDASVLKKRPGEAGFSWHAHIPQPATFDYLVKPKSFLSESSKGHRSRERAGTPDAFKKLNQKMRSKR